MPTLKNDNVWRRRSAVSCGTLATEMDGRRRREFLMVSKEYPETNLMDVESVIFKSWPTSGRNRFCTGTLRSTTVTNPTHNTSKVKTMNPAKKYWQNDIVHFFIFYEVLYQQVETELERQRSMIQQTPRVDHDLKWLCQWDIIFFFYLKKHRNHLYIASPFQYILTST